VADIKFCGLTRERDVVHAASLGASWVGFILAPSPRQRSIAEVRVLRSSLGTDGPAPVGVFVSPTLDELARATDALALQAVQVHGTLPLPPRELRERLGTAVWCVAGVEGAAIVGAGPLPADEADVLLFDTSVGGRTGGSGRAFDWAAARGAIDALRPRTRIALAGGLGPHNVVAAIQSLAPDIVDVSSGVETTPGVKDHEMMTAFAAAVRAAVPA
jgi:phosphoribosylanthranilate isomerase